MKGLKRSLKNVTSVVKKQTIPISNLSVSVADGAPGFGTSVIAGLPQGNILYLGAVGYLQFTTSDADITTTFDGDFSIGTTATADNTITGSDGDIIPSTAMGAATAKVSPVIRCTSTDALQGIVIDNTANDLELNLNVIIDDAAISGAAVFTVKGSLQICYVVMGDD